MSSIYRSAEGEGRIQRWCTEQLDRWSVPHRRLLLPTRAGVTHAVTTGTGSPSVVVVAGTNFNTATSLPLVEALARHRATVMVDVPGQPGLSDPDRPRRADLLWYADWLSEVLGQVTDRPVTVVGHSLGGGISLACDSSRIAGRVLLAPAGIVRLRITPRLLTATVPWLVRPTDARSAGLLQVMHGPDRRPSPVLTHWMTLVARHCRSSLAPALLSADRLRVACAVPLRVATGEHDVFLPPRRLRPAAARVLSTKIRVVAGAGHLLPEEAPDQVVVLLDEVVNSAGQEGEVSSGPADHAADQASRHTRIHSPRLGRWNRSSQQGEDTDDG